MLYEKNKHYYISRPGKLIEVKPIVNGMDVSFEILGNEVEYLTDKVPGEYKRITAEEIREELSNKKIEEDTKFNGIFGEKSTKNKKTI